MFIDDIAATRSRTDDLHIPWSSGSHPDERIAHLVLLDGRLVDAWSEPVEGTRWEAQARRFDLRHTCAPRSPEPDRHAEMLEWLSRVCGGRDALDAVTGTPLREQPDRDSTDAAPLDDGLARLLRTAARSCFDPETEVALRRAARVVGDEISGVRTVDQLAGGICWVVGKANGLFGAGTGTTLTRVQEALGLTTSLTTCGRQVLRALLGLAWPNDRHPYGAVDLLVVGRTDLLVSTTRRSIVRWRDHARECQATARTATAQIVP